MADQPLPHNFGRYVLRERVGRGGMAEVFRASLPGFGGFDKVVAIKRMFRQFGHDPGFVQMLTDEAKIVCQLMHPNIVQILDVGRLGDDYYIAFEYVEGIDLFAVLQRHHEAESDMPVPLACFIVAELCDALDHAHSRRAANGQSLGIVHRDVSPQNVLLSLLGEVKLTDFGIAKAAHRFTQTQAGMVKGKIYYMSPEQVLGQAIDHRADLFAAGILLYEALTTQPLYDEPDQKKLVEAVGRANFQWPAAKAARVPLALQAIVSRALQPRAEDRFQTGRELRAAIVGAMRELGLHGDRDALGVYLRAMYGVEQDRPPTVVAHAQMVRPERDQRWNSRMDVHAHPPELGDEPTQRDPSKPPNLPRGAVLQPKVAAEPVATTLPKPVPPGPPPEVRESAPRPPPRPPLRPPAARPSSAGMPPPLPTDSLPEERTLPAMAAYDPPTDTVPVATMQVAPLMRPLTVPPAKPSRAGALDATTNPAKPSAMRASQPGVLKEAPAGFKPVPAAVVPPPLASALPPPMPSAPPLERDEDSPTQPPSWPLARPPVAAGQPASHPARPVAPLPPSASPPPVPPPTPGPAQPAAVVPPQRPPIPRPSPVPQPSPVAKPALAQSRPSPAAVAVADEATRELNQDEMARRLSLAQTFEERATEDATRSMPAMDDAGLDDTTRPRHLRTRQPEAPDMVPPTLMAAEVDPDDQPASNVLLIATAMVWVMAVVLAVYATLITVRRG